MSQAIRKHVLCHMKKINSDQVAHSCMEAQIAQLGKRQTLDRTVADSILTRGRVLCP